jgi:hypothetical protein
MQTKQPRYFSDGRPMLTMTIPLLVQQQPDFPDGRAAWIIGSSDREDLDMAMQQAGCKPRTVPEAGAVVTITFTGLKQIPGFGAPKKVKRITYQRPPNANGNGNGQATTQAINTALQNAQPQQPYVPAPSPAPAPAHQESFGAPEGLGYNPGSGYTQYAPPQAPPPGYQQPPPVPQPAYQQDPYATATGQPQQPPPPPQAPPQGPPPQQPQFATPAELTPEQAERLRQLTGGQ